MTYLTACAKTQAMMITGQRTPWLMVQKADGDLVFSLEFPATREFPARIVMLDELTLNHIMISTYMGKVKGGYWEYELCTHLGKGEEYLLFEFEGKGYSFTHRNVMAAIKRVNGK